MGTLKNPGLFDCLAKLKEDEPYFLLKATDPLAPFIVEAWAQRAKGDLNRAVRALQMSSKVDGMQPDAKTQEALDCANNMRTWLASQGVEAEVDPAKQADDDFRKAFDDATKAKEVDHGSF